MRERTVIICIQWRDEFAALNQRTPEFRFIFKESDMNQQSLDNSKAIETLNRILELELAGVVDKMQRKPGDLASFPG